MSVSEMYSEYMRGIVVAIRALLQVDAANVDLLAEVDLPLLVAALRFCRMDQRATRCYRSKF